MSLLGVTFGCNLWISLLDVTLDVILLCHFLKSLLDRVNILASRGLALWGDGWNNRQTDNRQTDIATYRLNWPRADSMKPSMLS